MLYSLYRDVTLLGHEKSVLAFQLPFIAVSDGVHALEHENYILVALGLALMFLNEMNYVQSMAFNGQD